jgi:hypothetical protein
MRRFGLRGDFRLSFVSARTGLSRDLQPHREPLRMATIVLAAPDPFLRAAEFPPEFI